MLSHPIPTLPELSSSGGELVQTRGSWLIQMFAGAAVARCLVLFCLINVKNAAR